MRLSNSGVDGGANRLGRLAPPLISVLALTALLAGPRLTPAVLAQEMPPQAGAETSSKPPEASPTAKSAEPSSSDKPPEASSSDIDGETMFATSCGFCHEAGGRVAGKGPKLSNSARSDEYIIERIKKGKPGAMPAFGRVFSDGQIMAILAYIRGLDQ
jgi:mono/diheme cytochrome c family protein